LDRALEAKTDVKELGWVSEPRALNFEIRAIRALWLEQYAEVQEAVKQERILRSESQPPSWTFRIQGLIALGLGDLGQAEEYLYSAMVLPLLIIGNYR
jgi:hypothetical protein